MKCPVLGVKLCQQEVVGTVDRRRTRKGQTTEGNGGSQEGTDRQTQTVTKTSINISNIFKLSKTQ